MSGIQSVVRDKAGNAIASATVTVFITGTATAASIFSDPELTQPQVNPFVADSSGFYSFYADTAVYDIQFEKAGFPTVLLTEVELALGAFGGTINGNVIINGNLTVTGTITGSIDHSTLLNLASDDHLQYLNRSGVRPMTGDLDMGENDLTDATRITGPDTGGVARPGLLMTEGAGPEMSLVFNEALLPGTPDILLNSDGINFGPPVRGIGPAKIVFEDELQMQSNLITGVLDPVGPQDAATKAYVDASAPTQSVDDFLTVKTPPAQGTVASTRVELVTNQFNRNSGLHTFNGNRVVIGIAGLYVFHVQVKWAVSAVGHRQAWLMFDVGGGGAGFEIGLDFRIAMTGGFESVNKVFSYQQIAAVGDEVWAEIEQDAGALNVDPTETWFQGYRIG